VAAAQAKGPTLMRIEGKLWVVGLPYKHGWARERRVLLTQRDAARGVDRKVGVVVVLDDSYASAAPVGIVYDEPGESFDGAHAEIVPSDQRLRVGRGFGSLSAVVTSLLVEITLGSQDGVEVGDVYEVLALEGTKAVARVKVVSLEATRAKATVLNAWPMVAGQEVVYQKKTTAEEQAKQAGVTIVVCDFEPMAHDVDVARAGQSFAAALAKDLRGAAASWPGLTVMYVPQIVDSHASARIVGRDKQADVVVWGAATCVKDVGCAQPSYTVVDPAKLAKAELSGKEVKFDPGSPWSAIAHGSAKDPTGIVVGLLGSLAYEAQRYGDAAFYLGRVPEGALEGADHFRALRDLGYSQYVLGRLESALDTAGKLAREARGSKDRGWEAVGVSDRARILKDKGQVDEALKLHREALAVYEALGDRRSRAAMLGDIARILTAKGQMDEALKLHRERLAVYEELGDRRSRAMTLGDIAHIFKDAGQVDEALKLHREELAIYEALDDRRSRSAALFDVAQIHFARKDIPAALPMLRESYEVLLALGDARGTAFVGQLFAVLLLKTGAKKEAEPVVTRAAEAFTKIGKPDRAAALRALLASTPSAPP
jgi:tetratricopeptide (TPR) repeat protein